MRDSKRRDSLLWLTTFADSSSGLVGECDRPSLFRITSVIFIAQIASQVRYAGPIVYDEVVDNIQRIIFNFINTPFHKVANGCLGAKIVMATDCALIARIRNLGGSRHEWR